MVKIQGQDGAFHIFGGAQGILVHIADAVIAAGGLIPHHDPVAFHAIHAGRTAAVHGFAHVGTVIVPSGAGIDVIAPAEIGIEINIQRRHGPGRGHAGEAERYQQNSANDSALHQKPPFFCEMRVQSKKIVSSFSMRRKRHWKVLHSSCSERRAGNFFFSGFFKVAGL